LSVFGATAPSAPWPPHSRGFYITHDDAPHSVGFLWAGDKLVAETSTLQHTNSRHPAMPPVGFQPTISARERPQNDALVRAATGNGYSVS
jgi:hypothetical protein